MNREQAIAIIENEKECVNRANKNDYCNRDCYNCELVKTDTEILTALDMAIKALEKESCEDVVSRQAAIDALGEKPLSWTEDEYEFGLQNQWQSDVDAIKALPSAQPERTCVNCGRTVNNGGWYADGRTRCPIEEHYVLPKDGYCHLWEKRNVTDDDYPERREE